MLGADRLVDEAEGGRGGSRAQREARKRLDYHLAALLPYVLGGRGARWCGGTSRWPATGEIPSFALLHHFTA